MTSCDRDSFAARVIDCRPSGRDGFALRVALPRRLVTPLEGGHFFMVRTEGADFPFLSRPFSVHDVAPDGCGPELAFVFKSVGPGTRALARLKAGDPIRLTGPLGRPFPTENSGANPGVTTLLVAGGVGLPPLFLWLRRRLEMGRDDRALLLYGARFRDQLFELDAAELLGVPVRTATEDGSHGMRGRVDKLLAVTLDELARDGETPVRIFTCGPDPMMAAVARLAAERGVECLVSLETLMACGFGVCNACAVPVRNLADPAADPARVERFARACIDGPVMDSRAVHWHAAAH